MDTLERRSVANCNAATIVACANMMLGPKAGAVTRLISAFVLSMRPSQTRALGTNLRTWPRECKHIKSGRFPISLQSLTSTDVREAVAKIELLDCLPAHGCVFFGKPPCLVAFQLTLLYHPKELHLEKQTHPHQVESFNFRRPLPSCARADQPALALTKARRGPLVGLWKPAPLRFVRVPGRIKPIGWSPAWLSLENQEGCPQKKHVPSFPGLNVKLCRT